MKPQSVVLALAAALAAPLAAQQPRVRAPAPSAALAPGEPGLIRGVVYDSLSRSPLTGARVLVQGTDLGATTDGGGRFRIESVPPGRQTLFVEHPALDSIGLSTLVQSVTVPSGRAIIVDLATPSLWTIRRAACGGRPVPLTRDSGLVFGAVRDADTGVRLAGVRVAVSWVAARRGLSGVEVERPSTETRTDSLGNYYACDVPTAIVITIQAAAGAHVTGATEHLLGERGVARHDLVLSRSGSVSVDSISGLRRGRAAIAGTIVNEDGGPRPGARVSVDDAVGEAYSDEQGRFTLTGLPAGSRMLMARLIGYSAARRQVDLADGDTARVELSMRQVNVLDTIQVTASARVSAELDELQERARQGLGYRLSAEELRTRTSMRSVLTGFPSLTVEGRSAYSFQLLARGTAGYCAPSLYIDGRPGTTEEVQSYRPEQLISVEYFPRVTQAPLRYQGMNNCAVVLVWTRFIR